MEKQNGLKQSQKGIWILLIIFSLAGIFLILFSSKNYSVGVSSDSIAYFKMADQIIEGEKVNTATWPPFYPLILALNSKIFNLSYTDAARFLNAFSYGAIMLIGGLLLIKEFSDQKIFVIFGLAALLFSVPMLPVFLYAWSEIPFILFSLLFIYFFIRYNETNKMLYLVLGAIFASFCCLTRYIGVALIPLGVLMLWLRNNKFDKKLFTEIIFYGSISAIPISAWLVRNYIILGSFTGTRYATTYGLIDQISATIGNLIRWFIPMRLADFSTLIFSLLLIIIFIGALHCNLHIEFNLKKIDNWNILFYELFIIFYTLFLIASYKSYWQPVDNRYLSPIYVPLVILLCIFLSRVFSQMNTKTITTKIILAAILFCLLVIPIKQSIEKITYTLNEGLGLTARVWRESETLNFLQNNQLDCALYSNGSDVIEFYTGLESTTLPRKLSGNTQILFLEDLSMDWPIENEKTCLVWLNNRNRNYFFYPNELLQISVLEQEIKLSDGTIYVLNRPSP